MRQPSAMKIYFDKRLILYFSVISIALLVIVYICNNYAFPYGNSTNKLTFIESLIQSLGRDASKVDTSCIFINVGYDADLVETRHGKEKITDRSALLRILDDLERRADYKEVFIDIRFEQELHTQNDSALVRRILTMPNVCIVKHWDYGSVNDYPLIDDRLLCLAGYSDYSGTIFDTSFSRYEFIQHGGASVALKMYNDIDGSSIVRHGKGLFSFYCDGGKLCNNAAFIRIPENMSSRVLRYRDDNHTFRYYNLSEDIYGTMILDKTMQDAFFNDCKNKVIVIGDFVSDQHDTYFYKQPGPYLNYLAYTTLRDGQHIVRVWIALIAFLAYFGSLLLIFYKISPVRLVLFLLYCVFIILTPAKKHISVRNKYERVVNSQVIVVVSRFIDSVGILSLVSYFLFITTGRVLNIFLPSFVFSCVEFVLSFKSPKK